MTDKQDKRSQKRIQCDVSTYIRRVDDHFIYSAKIKNYDKNGLYFETDRTLHLGDEILLGLNSSSDDSDTQAPYRAKVIWMRRFQSSQFRYGYGARDTTESYLQETNDLKGQKPAVDMRSHDRRVYLQPVLYIK